jgi:hypothetical protein
LGEIVRSDGSKEHIAIKKMKDKKEHMADNTDMDFRREFEILQVITTPILDLALNSNIQITS